MRYVDLLRKDKKLSRIILEPMPALRMDKNIPVRLMASIMSQQLSTTVAKIIYKRFLELYGGQEPLPQEVLDTPFESLRAIGLSNAKVSYVQNVAKYCIENKITDKTLKKLPNEAIVELLTPIKGVGRWTVEMLLMFSLGREDVFPADDLGIMQAMVKIYNLDLANKKELKAKMLQLSQKWAPYRTYACLHLWSYKDS